MARRGRRCPDHGPVRQGREPVVDGDTSSVHVFGTTVGDVLDKQDVAVGEHDVVQPAADAPLNDGDTVVVRYGRKLTVTVDGKTTEYWTTATTVDAALAELGIRADARRAVGVPLPAARPFRPGARPSPPPRTSRSTSTAAARPSPAPARPSPTPSSSSRSPSAPRTRVNPATQTPLDRGHEGRPQARRRSRSGDETEAVALLDVTKQEDATSTKGQTKVRPPPRATPASKSRHLRRGLGRRQARVPHQDRSPQVTKKPVDHGRRRRHQGRDPAPRPRRRPRRPAPAPPPAPASTWPARPRGTGSPSASPAAPGTSTPATATTAVCSSTATPGASPAV